MVRAFLGVTPVYDETNYIAPSAEVIGDVTLGKGASVWFNATVRGDVNWIRIGAASNIQDNAVVHVTKGVAPTDIGEGVTVGHSAVVHGCTVEDNVLVGMGAVLLDHCVIGRDSIVGARALVTQGTRIPPRSLVLGSPARVVRELTDEEVEQIRTFARNYLHYSAIYRGEARPETNPFYER
ncbi:gamma carbonic anhydrase family protein [Rhodocaloribacter litoris]|uniref:gamma carbonic anhydrase family protein n=1 Tax=Rhodocaloribacter litoris TaxID=2558931 RepID=UPI001420965E|nr:gamma carbonic anhydrase family protein [Rhodocaloribacter litoris]QXD15969.1 gamma carbonic anhydrase family protein [Rhodocaloribacter litoris]